MERDNFLQLPVEEVVKLAQGEDAPKVGIFIPDGNRRFLLIDSDVEEGTEKYFIELADKQTDHGLKSFRVFFEHGLPVLFTPLFSRDVLERRDELYRRLTAFRTLKTLFAAEKWLGFYHEFKIRVRVYGNPEILRQPDYEEVIDMISQVEESTRKYFAHTLYIGIGGEPWVGSDAAIKAIEYYKIHNHAPANKEDLIEFIYGQRIHPADFVIFSGKPGGLGALPALITGKNTQLFYLPAPGVLALNQTTYRMILHNLIYVKKISYNLTPVQREELRAKYANMVNVVIGLGQNVGPVWMPVIED